AAAGFATSRTLSIVARYGEKPIDILDRVPATSDGAGKGVLNQLPGTTTPAPAGSTTPTPPSGNDAAAPATAPATAPAAGSTPPATNGTAPAAPATPQVPNQ
ncbi:preprotein translocase subunit SecG, partial [Mesorhizobium sp. M7A.F.Ca.CA.004.04.2.1]